MWVVPRFLVSPFCSEPGAVSASQDTRLQSACEGGLRPGPLCPLPWPGLALGLPQAYQPWVLSVDTTDRATWQFWLQPDGPIAQQAHPNAVGPEGH